MKRVAPAVAVLVALCAPIAPAAAQRAGILEASVVDPYGDPVAGAEVTARSVSGYREVARTDTVGRVRFDALVAGSYTLDAQADFGRGGGVDVAVSDLEPTTVRLVVEPDVPPGFVARPLDPQGLALPGAVVTAAGPAGEAREAVTDSRGTVALTGLRSGTWRLEVVLPGFVGTPVDVQVAWGPPPVVDVPLELAGFGDVVVVSATRTPVRMVEAPVSTSVINADRIATSAAGDVADMLRAVPGVNVVRFSPRDLAVTTRGATTLAANSQLVLVDGRSAYLDFFGGVLWDTMTFTQSDVEQIEVVRGPASATWGANAMTGAVNILTREPRRSVGTDVTLWGGVHDRNAGSTAGLGAGTIYGTNASVTRAPTEDIAYRVSAGHYRSDGYPRPAGRVPVADDPRVDGRRVGGAVFPDLFHLAASQTKFDARLDQRVHGGRGRLSYSGGVATPQGTTHTALGPFDLRDGYRGYAKVNYERDALSVQVFANLLDGVAPSLLFPETRLSFTSRTLDGELVHRRAVGRHRLTYGGNLRRVTFDVDIASGAPDRTEAARFVQDEYDTEHFRTVAAARVDKFGNIAQPFFSPRLALGVKFGPDHIVTGSYSRAFRAPSAVEAFLDQSVVVPIDFSPLAAFRPLLLFLVPPSVTGPARTAAVGALETVLDATTAEPFPLHTRAIGGSVPYYSGVARADLVQESVDSYEFSYSATVGPARTAVGAAVYRSDFANLVGLLEVPPETDPFTEEHPPPGWLLPPSLLPVLSAFGGSLPRTSLAHENLGDHYMSGSAAGTHRLLYPGWDPTTYGSFRVETRDQSGTWTSPFTASAARGPWIQFPNDVHGRFHLSGGGGMTMGCVGFALVMMHGGASNYGVYPTVPTDTDNRPCYSTSRLCPGPLGPPFSRRPGCPLGSSPGSSARARLRNRASRSQLASRIASRIFCYPEPSTVVERRWLSPAVPPGGPSQLLFILMVRSLPAIRLLSLRVPAMLAA